MRRSLCKNLYWYFVLTAEQSRQFGKAGGMFDFSQHDIPKLREKTKELEDQQKGMKKMINPKVMNMIDK